MIADFLYKCTGFYDPDDEQGLAWDDPDVGIRWPHDTPLLFGQLVGSQERTEQLHGHLSRLEEGHEQRELDRHRPARSARPAQGSVLRTPCVCSSPTRAPGGG